MMTDSETYLLKKNCIWFGNSDEKLFWNSDEKPFLKLE